MNLKVAERSKAYRKAASRPAFLPEALAAGAAVLLVAVILWVAGGVSAIIAAQAQDLVVRVVLREEATPSSAAQLAAMLQREEPGLNTTVVDPEEARSRLALQEKWMQHLPEAQLADLPTVIEARHPLALSAPDLLLGLVARLEQRPEVQFVQFNSLGYDSMVRFAQGASRLAMGMAGVIVAGAALLYALFGWAASNRGGSGGRALQGAIIGAAVGGGAAFGFGYLAASPALGLPAPGLILTAAVAVSAIFLRWLTTLGARDLNYKRSDVE